VRPSSPQTGVASQPRSGGWLSARCPNPRLTQDEVEAHPDYGA
jgi:hypothetical protein